MKIKIIFEDGSTKRLSGVHDVVKEGKSYDISFNQMWRKISTHKD